MQEDRSLFNQDFKAEPAWSISSGHRKSGSVAFPDFNSWRALVNSSGKKSPEIHLSGGVRIFQRWDTSLTTSLAQSRFVVLYVPFLMCIFHCEGIELEAIRQRRCVCLALSVKLSILFHVSRLECVKLMLPTSSDKQSFCFSSR